MRKLQKCIYKHFTVELFFKWYGTRCYAECNMPQKNLKMM